MKKRSVEIEKKLKRYSNYILIFVFGLMLLSLVRNLLKIRQADEKIRQEKERIKALQEENKKLTEALKEVKSEEFVEKQLRNKLGLAKEGEVVIVLPEPEKLRELAPKIVEEEEVLPPPNWKKWLELFY